MNDARNIPPNESEPTLPRGLMDELRRLQPPAPQVPPELDDAIAAAARAQLAPVRRRRLLFRFAPVAGIAAAAAVVATVFWPTPTGNAPPAAYDLRPHTEPPSVVSNLHPQPTSPAIVSELRPHLALPPVADDTTPAPATDHAEPAPVAVAAVERPAPGACNGTATILDAFALARHIRDGAAPRAEWDCNRDGVVDRRDVDALALAAVQLHKGT